MSFRVKILGNDATAKTVAALRASTDKSRARAKEAALKAINATLDANAKVKRNIK